MKARSLARIACYFAVLCPLLPTIFLQKAVAAEIKIYAEMDYKEMSMKSDGMTAIFRIGLRSIDIDNTKADGRGSLMISCGIKTRGMVIKIPSLEQKWPIADDESGSVTFSSVTEPIANGAMRFSVLKDKAAISLLVSLGSYAPDVAKVAYSGENVWFDIPASGNIPTTHISIAPPSTISDFQRHMARLARACELP